MRCIVGFGIGGLAVPFDLLCESTPTEFRGEGGREGGRGQEETEGGREGNDDNFSVRSVLPLGANLVHALVSSLPPSLPPSLSPPPPRQHPPPHADVLGAGLRHRRRDGLGGPH
jgi:hypothetical protein